MISVFGSTGFIGSRFCEMYPDDVYRVPREDVFGKSGSSLYLVSTTHNYIWLNHDVYTNLWILSTILENLCANDTFNFVSSWFIYRGAFLPAQEWQGEICDPLGNYAITKWLAEKLVIQYCEKEDIPYRIFRLANVFGKGDKYSKQKNALQYLVNEMRHDRDIDLYYGGDFIRDYIHVDEVCRLLYEGMERLPVNDIYNIGSGVPIRFGDWINFAYGWLGSKSEIRATEPSEFHKKVQVKDFYMDISKIMKYGLVPERYKFMLEHFKEVVLDE